MPDVCEKTDTPDCNPVNCAFCVHGRISYTNLLGHVISEWYCGLTHTDEYCDGNNFIEEEE